MTGSLPSQLTSFIGRSFDCDDGSRELYSLAYASKAALEESYKRDEKYSGVECVEQGDTWVQLCLCMSCRHIGCCENAKNKHATKHFHATQHPIIMSNEPDESWGWYYVEQGYFESLAAVLEQMGKPAPPLR